MDIVNIIYFVLMQTVIFKTGCECLIFVNTSKTWEEAKTHCINEFSGTLACLSPDKSEYMLDNVEHGESIWIGAYTTFSSWYKEKDVPNLEISDTYHVSSDDMATCQLLCGRYFTVDDTKCKCYQRIHSDSEDVKVYEVGYFNDIRGNVKNRCRYMFCSKNIYNDWWTKYVTVNSNYCDYDDTDFIAFCAMDGIEECVDLSTLKSYAISTYQQMICKLFEITKTDWIGRRVSPVPDYISGIGHRSAMNDDTPKMTCLKGRYTKKEDGEYQIEFQETSDCGETHPFFCDREVGTADSPAICSLDRFTFSKPSTTSTTAALTTARTTTTTVVAESTTAEGTTTTSATATKTMLSSTTKFATTSIQTPTTETIQNENNESDTTSTQNVTRTPLIADAGTSGAITGIAVAVSLALTAVIVTVLLFMWKRYKHKKVEKPSTDQRLSDIQATTNPSYEVHTHSKQRSEYEDTKESDIYQTLEPNEYTYIDSDYNSNAVDKANAYVQPSMIPNKKVKRGAGKIAEKNTPKVISNAVYEESQNRPHAYLDLKPDDSNFPVTDLPENYFVLMPEGAKPSAKKESSLPDNYFILEPSADDNVKQMDKNMQKSKKTNVRVDPSYELQTVPATDSKVNKPATNAETNLYSLEMNMDGKAKSMSRDNKEHPNGDYFLLEPENYIVHNKREPESEYVDSEESAYDHLHGTFVRKPDINQDHLYAHTNNLGNRDLTYDTTNGEHRYKRDSTYDSMKDMVGDDSVYDTTCTKN